MNKAVFFDKDGTLIKDVPYNVDIDKVVFYPDVPLALKRLKEQGFKIVIITNQSGVAHGYFHEQELTEVWSFIESKLSGEGATLDGFYYCPHHPSGKNAAYAIECTCRKPKPGLLKKAAAELSIDLSESWMVGDILNDVECGNSAGCKSVLLDVGSETEWVVNTIRTPKHIAKTVSEAVDKIINEAG